MKCEGRPVVVVSLAEYRRRALTSVWVDPADVPALRAAQLAERPGPYTSTRPRADLVVVVAWLALALAFAVVGCLHG